VALTGGPFLVARRYSFGRGPPSKIMWHCTYLNRVRWGICSDCTPLFFILLKKLAIMSWSAQPDIDTYYQHSHAYYAQTHAYTSASIHQSSLPPSSWSAQPGIDVYIDAYRPHTHAYTQSLNPHQSPLPVSSYSSLTGALDLPPANGRTRSYVCSTRLPTDMTR
jgi:hypothetical protein